MPSFGRREAHAIGDDQDAVYAMRLALPPTPPVLPNFRYWMHLFPPLDQGAESTCVAHALKHWMQAAPVIQTSPTRNPFPRDIYDDLILIDEWPQNDSDSARSFGTSVRAAFKWAQKAGYVAEYRWALSPDDLSEWLLTKGPVVIGVGWFEGMMTPDAQGFVHHTGAYRGGHAVCLIGHNRVRGDYTFINSWGGWGRKGRARISATDLHRLIFSEGGEAAAGLERRLM